MKSEMSIFFMGSGVGAEAALSGLMKSFSSIAVVSQDHRVLDKMRPADQQVIAPEGPSLPRRGVMAGYQRILSEEFLKNRFVLNVHYSLLPRWRGMHSVVWAILNGDERVGWSIHQATTRLDAGRVFYQHSQPYLEESSGFVMKTFHRQVQATIGPVVKDIFDGIRPGWSQQETDATWGPRRNLEDCLINFGDTVDHLDRFFRALVRPYPLPALVCDGRRFEVSSYRLFKKSFYCTVGRVLANEEEGSLIKCADGVLVVRELIDSQGRKTNPHEVLALGTRLAQP